MGEMSRRRDLFILLAHGKVITNIAQDTQADFFCWFKIIKIELKEILFFFIQYIQYRLLHKHNQNSARYISVWLCTLYWECVYCSCLLGFSSISPGFRLLSQILCLWVKIVAIAYQAETLWGNILSCLMVMKTSEVVGKLSMLIWYQTDGLIVI